MQYVFGLTQGEYGAPGGHLWRSNDFGRDGTWTDVSDKMQGMLMAACHRRREHHRSLIFWSRYVTMSSALHASGLLPNVNLPRIAYLLGSNLLRVPDVQWRCNDVNLGGGEGHSSSAGGCLLAMQLCWLPAPSNPWPFKGPQSTKHIDSHHSTLEEFQVPWNLSEQTIHQAFSQPQKTLGTP